MIAKETYTKIFLKQNSKIELIKETIDQIAEEKI